MRRRTCSKCGQKMRRYESLLAKDGGTCWRCVRNAIDQELADVARVISDAQAAERARDIARASTVAIPPEPLQPHLPSELHGSGDECPGCIQLWGTLYPGRTVEDAIAMEEERVRYW